MTCGESRFVFTVINALCNSLKTIKEAEVFFFFFFFFLLMWLMRLLIHYTFPPQENITHTVHEILIILRLLGQL